MKTRLKGPAGVVTALGMLAIAFVGGWEGLRLYSYKDPIGVWTYCYGETKDARPGMKFTKEQCDDIFIDSGLARHERALRRCLDEPDAVPMKTYVAMLSLAYNIGEGGFCKSSIARKWNAGDRKGSCNAFLLYNKAGGRVLQGLVNRRKAEQKLCLDGLNEPVALPNPEEVKPADRPVLRRGASGFWVEELQKALGIKADGQFGPLTEKAVKTFQVERELIIDGVAGAQTWKALAGDKTAWRSLPPARRIAQRPPPRKIAAAPIPIRRAA